MNKKYILIIIILFVIGVFICLNMSVWDDVNIPVFLLDKETEIETEQVSPLDCDKEYIITCFEPGGKVMAIECSVDEDCLFENMESYCSPGIPDLFNCDKGKEHYCGERGFCKGCVCVH